MIKKRNQLLQNKWVYLKYWIKKEGNNLNAGLFLRKKSDEAELYCGKEEGGSLFNVLMFPQKQKKPNMRL